jgi:hypothetical protein
MNANRNVFRAMLAAIGFICLVIVLIVVSTKRSSAERSLFTGYEQHVVTLDQAKGWTANFQKDAPKEALIAGFFGKTIFERIIGQDNCVGIRIYNAKHENGNPVFVLVGVDASGKDLTSGVVGEGILPCPPFCGECCGNELQSATGAQPLALVK